MSGKTVVIYNKGQRTIFLSNKRVLESSKTIEVAEEESKKLLDYNDLVTFDNIKTDSNKEEIISKLSEQLKKAEAKLAAVMAELESQKKEKNGGKK